MTESGGVVGARAAARNALSGRSAKLLGAILMLLLLLGTDIALAAQGDAEAPAPDPSLSAAPAPGEGTEIEAKRTATSDTFKLPDGRREVRIYPTPVNYRNSEGGWKPIEEGLEETASGKIVNSASSVEVELPSRLGAGPVRVSAGSLWVASELLGPATASGEVEAGVASYEGADPETDFRLSSLPGGVKEKVEISSPAAPTTFRFALSASAGLKPEIAGDGSVQFRDDAGRLAATLPAPVMSDSSGRPDSLAAATYKLEPAGGGGWTLSVEADKQWLAEPDRSFPVELDPTVTFKEGVADCMITNFTGLEDHHFCAAGGYPTLAAAAWDYSSGEEVLGRSLISFNLSSIPTTASVSSATLGLYAPEAAKQTKGIWALKPEQPWSGSYASWLHSGYPNCEGCTAWTIPGGGASLPADAAGLRTIEERGGSGAGWWEVPIRWQTAQDWVAHPSHNTGLLLEQMGEKEHECVGSTCAQRSLEFESSAAAESEYRPYLSVVYVPQAPLSSVLSSPTEGTHTARRLKLKSKWTVAGVTGVSYQYREGRQGQFQTVPLELVRKANGEAVSKWPLPVTGVESEVLYFNVAQANANLRQSGGTVQVRAVFEGAGSAEGYSAPVETKVDRSLGGPKDATAPVGPGSVDLLTGNLSITRNDVSIPAFTSALEFSRSFNSRGMAQTLWQVEEEKKSALGPGWKPGAAVEEAGGSEWLSLKLTEEKGTYEEEIGEEEVVTREYSFAYATLTTLEGEAVSFAKQPSGAYATPPEMAGWSLTTAEGKYFLADPAGDRTTFENPGGGSEYVPTAISQAASATTTRVEYELKEEKKRLHWVFAPAPPAVGCTTPSEAMTHAGCHALLFSYGPATTWGAPASDGERLANITYYAPGIGVGHWEVASYKYDSQGRLIEEWDPRISPTLPEKYTYASGGQIATLTPPGQEPWKMQYGAIEEEEANGRLMSVKRASLLASPSETQTTIAYGVPLSPSESASAPNNMSASTVGQWGQKDPPTDATAIFPPSEVPSSPPSAYTKATVYYMDSEGSGVNTATPKGGGTSEPSISTSEADEFGNVVRELSPDNRLRAMAEPEAKRAERAAELDTHRHYSPDGTQMEEEWGPMHQVRLESGTLTQARSHKVLTYNKGWPGTGVNPHLPTEETQGALVGGEFLDRRLSEIKYNWELRKPIETVIDPGSSETGHLAIKSVMAYDKETGLPTESRQPKEAEAKEPGSGTTKTIYYTASGSGECEGAPQYAGLPCKITPAAQIEGSGRPKLLVKKFPSYNALGEPTEVIESPGGGAENVRKTLITYDAAGRQLTKKYEGGGEPIPKTETVYSPTLGLPEKQQFVCEGTECPEGGFSYQSSFGSSGTGNGQFAHPGDVAIDAKGNLWVADDNNNRLQEFNEKGEFIKTFGSSGTGNGQFSVPKSIAFTAAGNFWVADSGNSRLQEFNEKGEFLKAVGVLGSGNGNFNRPEGIAIDAKGNLWVADTYNYRVQELNEKGEFIKVVNPSGLGAIEPTGLDSGPGGNVWVADWAHNRVVEFSESGELVRSFGTEGTGNGQFKRPDAVTVDPSGNVWVGDQNNSRVQEFNQKAEYVGKFGTSGTGAGQFAFSYPLGIAADAKGDLWVTDTNNNRVEKWTLTSSFDAQATTTTYDALGRPTGYEDADGNKSSVTYDLEGRPVTTSDGKGTQTATYDPTSGLLTKLEDSAAGTFTAAYDADGNMTERTLPDGLTAKTTYNEIDEPIHLTYTKASSCGTSCTWLDEGLERSINGQIISDSGTLSKELYSYDKAGRLINVNDTPTGGTCVTRSYEYDADSNRKALSTRPGIGSTCSSSGGTTQTYSYDAADRLTGTGLTYDNFGRITSLPAEYAGGGKALSTSYFSNDMVATQEQGTVINTFQLDATGRQRQRLQNGGLEGVEVFHYAGASDSPAWTERGSVWTRNVTGIGGELIAVQDSSKGVTLQLTDLHGDVVATADPNPTTTKLLAAFRFDEFGNPEEGSAGRYGWLGGKQRRTELPSGVIQMGVRSYLPTLGRFLTPDPVRGGSANAYDYANQDPINAFDLTGEWSSKASSYMHRKSYREQRAHNVSHLEVHCSGKGGCHSVQAVNDGGAVLADAAKTVLSKTLDVFNSFSGKSTRSTLWNAVKSAVGAYISSTEGAVNRSLWSCAHAGVEGWFETAGAEGVPDAGPGARLLWSATKCAVSYLSP